MNREVIAAAPQRGRPAARRHITRSCKRRRTSFSSKA
jgi:hypothetical protein